MGARAYLLFREHGASSADRHFNSQLAGTSFDCVTDLYLKRATFYLGMVSDRASLYIFHGFSGLLLITYDQVTSTDNADTRPDNLCPFWCCDQRFWNWLGFEKWDLHWWLIFNAFIVLAAGAVYGWPYAFYSALGILVNARVMDMVYTRQQKMQVMIVTNKPKSVIDCIQNHMQRGITIVHGAEGAYKHDNKTILFTVISRYEQPELRQAMTESDPHAFVSIAENVHIMGHFYEPNP